MEENKIWAEHLTNMESRMSSMWNFILYNRYTDDKTDKLKTDVKNLNRGIKRIREKNNNLWLENKKLENDNSRLYYDNNNMYYKIEDLNKQIKLLNEKLIVKDIIDLSNDIGKGKEKRKVNKENKYKEKGERPEKKKKTLSWLDEIKISEPEDYEYMLDDERDKLLLERFSNLCSIDDIISLKDDKNVYDFLKLDKFSKLYSLIPSLEKLNNMVGMKKLKSDIFSMICYCLHEMNSVNDLNHIVLMGPPGVGKTSVAYLLGEIYKNLGFLSKNTFIRARRSDLIAEYLGQTAVKTQKLIDKAEGGVLFIDEVYSLGNKEKRDSFSKECIDTINQNLTEKSNNLLVIIAGYRKEVKECFFNYNPGLERRFPLQFNIDKYNAIELYEILYKIVLKENWSLSDKLCKYLKNEIRSNYNLFEYMGGDMETLFKFAKENYSRRLMRTLLTLESSKELTIEDFKYGIDRLKSNRIKDEIPDEIKNLYL